MGPEVSAIPLQLDDAKLWFGFGRLLILVIVVYTRSRRLYGKIPGVVASRTRGLSTQERPSGSMGRLWWWGRDKIPSLCSTSTAARGMAQRHLASVSATQTTKRLGESLAPFGGP